MSHVVAFNAKPLLGEYTHTHTNKCNSMYSEGQAFGESLISFGCYCSALPIKGQTLPVLLLHYSDSGHCSTFTQRDTSTQVSHKAKQDASVDFVGSNY